jgi:hypothetical protein
MVAQCRHTAALQHTHFVNSLSEASLKVSSQRGQMKSTFKKLPQFGQHRFPPLKEISVQPIMCVQKLQIMVVAPYLLGKWTAA